MSPSPSRKTGELMPNSNPAERKITTPNVLRHTPFEHEIAAEPSQVFVTGSVETRFEGVWQKTVGTVVHSPLLPAWMTIFPRLR
jgi:hypothetical protein